MKIRIKWISFLAVLTIPFCAGSIVLSQDKTSWPSKLTGVSARNLPLELLNPIQAPVPASISGVASMDDRIYTITMPGPIHLVLETVLTGKDEDTQPLIAAQPVISEDLLCVVDVKHEDVLVSLDGRNVAWEKKLNKKKVIVVNGIAGPEFDDVGSPIFSRDGKRIAYTARTKVNKKKKWMVVVDGAAGPGFDSVASPIFSRDGKRIAYTAQTKVNKKKKWMVVVDGVAGPEFEYAYLPVFSSDSQHIAYWAQLADKRAVIVIDGEQKAEPESLGPIPGLGNIVLSPDTRRWAYWSNKGKARNNLYGPFVMMLDGKEQANNAKFIFHSRGPSSLVQIPIPLQAPPVFSPDSSHVAYGSLSSDSQKQVMVLDGNEGPEYDLVSHPMFSPDSRHFAYIAEREGKGMMVYDGEEGPPFDIIYGIVFSEDGSRFSYAGAYHKSDIAKDVNAGRVIIDGVQGDLFEGEKSGHGFLGGFFSEVFSSRYSTKRNPNLNTATLGVSGPVFSPDGKHIAFAARRGEGDFAVFLDGQDGPGYENIYFLTFSPDGQRLAYIGLRAKKLQLILDGKELGVVFDSIAPPMFGPDGRHIACAGLHNGKWLLAIDNTQGKPYDYIFPKTVSFTTENTVVYTARLGQAYYRVTQEVPK
jgi:Tol biopolymer transport system component